MIFVDASAFVAIIADEPDAQTLAQIIETDVALICSALSIWETTAALCHRYRYLLPVARITVGNYVRDLDFRFVAIGERESALAISAYEKFGKGRHPAALNMGDCFAYACTKTNNAKLLFKGDDFSQTDIEFA